MADEKAFDLLAAIRKKLAERFDVAHTTVQIERTPFEQADGAHTFTVKAEETHQPEAEKFNAGHQH